jgi:hypothetical protein
MSQVRVHEVRAADSPASGMTRMTKLGAARRRCCAAKVLRPSRRFWRSGLSAKPAVAPLRAGASSTWVGGPAAAAMLRVSLWDALIILMRVTCWTVPRKRHCAARARLQNRRLYQSALSESAAGALRTAVHRPRPLLYQARPMAALALPRSRSCAAIQQANAPAEKGMTHQTPASR